MRTRLFSIPILACAVSVGCSSGTGSSGSSGDPVSDAAVTEDATVTDLDGKNYVWRGTDSGKIFLLHTFKYATNNIVEVSGSGTSAQYMGDRSGSAPSGYAFDLKSVDTKRVFDDWGTAKTLTCTLSTGKNELVCGSIVFTVEKSFD